MELLYEKYLPFQFKLYKRILDIPLPNKIKIQFEDFFKRIMKDNGEDTEELLSELKKQYQKISLQIIKVIREYGNSKSCHVLDEIQFIFICSYLLIEKYKLSQDKLATVWGMNKNDFSKLDIYPQRCHGAYTKIGTEKKKILALNEEDSEGLRIAEYINKNVQAIHACKAFVGITNDLDVFANISSTDKKAFVLTSPLYFDDDDKESREKANYSYARYLFALGNHLYNDKDKLVPAGSIKEKIIRMLSMNDISVFEENEILSRILAGESDLGSYIMDGRHNDFKKLRKEYIFANETVQLSEDLLATGYDFTGIEYSDVHFGAFEIELDELNEREQMDEPTNLTSEEIVIMYAQKSHQRIIELKPQLLECLHVKRLLEEKDFFLDNWIQYIRCSVKETCIITEPKENGVLQPLFEDKLKAAAQFWISSIIENKKMINESILQNVMSYLKDNGLLSYIDALNAPPSGRKEDANQNRNKNMHIYMMDEESDIFEFLDGLPFSTTGGKERPVLVYLDTDSHAVRYDEIEKLVYNRKVIIVVHDVSGYVKECKIKPIVNEELQLYVFDNGSGCDSDNK